MTLPSFSSLLFCAGLAWTVCAGAVAQSAAPERRLDINAYRVDGVYTLTPIAIETAVYPFLGPDRTPADVEAARAAVEKAYQSQGYQTVAVQIPPQKVEDGVVILQVIEGKVGRLRVQGSRYHSLDAIKAEAPSLAEGTVPNFKAVQRDIIALNQQADRQVTPSMRPGVEPGTIDVDLNVKDAFPLHGSLELNNRYSADTKPLRLNGSLRYDNLWQRGDSVGFSFLLAPQRFDDAKVFSGYYLARVKDVDWLSFMLQAVKQDSDVNTLGTINVAGRGEVIGLRALMTLPGEANFFHSVSVGLDYKHFDTDLTITGAGGFQTPITYYPFSALYTATWLGKDGTMTQLNAGVTFHLRGLGGDFDEFNTKRSGAAGSFIYFRGDLSHTQALPGDFQLYGQVQGQVSGQPLVSNEQISGGGIGTVRGYLESEATGDNGIFATIELRTPSLTLGKRIDEWRFHVFAEAGGLTVNEPLPEQDSRFALASVGVGTVIKFKEHFNGSLDVGLPLITRSPTEAGDVRLTFRLWGEF